MQSVYMLWHKFDLDADETSEILIGVFSSEARALAAQKASALKPGFQDHTDGFEIHEMPLDEDQWTEGFLIDDLRGSDSRSAS